MGVGKLTEPTFDQISDIPKPNSQRVADAFKQTKITEEKNIGETLNKFLRVVEKVNLSARDKAQLNTIMEWENMNKKDAPLSMFRNRAQKSVYDAYKQADAVASQRQVDQNQPVYRGGNPTKYKPLGYYNQTPLSPKVADLYKNGLDRNAIAVKDKEFIANAMKYGKTPSQAEALLKDFKDTLSGKMSVPNSNMAFFGGNRLAHDIPLPSSFTPSDPIQRIETLFRRKALNDAFYQHVESDPKVMAALGETKDAWRRDIPADKNGSIANTPPVRKALEQFQGEAQNPTSRLEGSWTNLASTLFVSSPAIDWVHKFGSNVINGPLALADNPIQFARTAIAMVKNIGSAIEHASDNGVIKMTARSVSSFWDSNATAAERISALAQGWRNISSLGGRTDKWNMALMQGGFEFALKDKVFKANKGDITSQQLLKKLDPSYAVGKDYDAKGIQSLASQAANYVHGTKDGRTMPPWMLSDSELSGFFKLAHWSISQTNRFMSDVYTPATKGNIVPLVNALMGSIVGGYVIRQLREEVQGKHGNIPDIKELQATQGGLAGNKGLVAYNLLSAVQYAGFMGVISQAIKYPVDKIFKNHPQGAVFPLDEIASDLSEQISNFVEAKANDPNFQWDLAATELMKHIFTTDVQLTRIGFNQAVNNGFITGTPAEKKILGDKLGQLRRFDMGSSLPYDSQEASQANPYMNIEQKQFKMTQDLPKAMNMLPKLVSNIITTYSDRPDVMMSKLKALKENQYETFPSLDGPSAISFSKYMNYLTKLKGGEEANKEFSDFMVHKIVNETKASAVP